MNIITGYRGEPHITAQEDRDLNIGLVGNSLTDVYVLNVGQQLEADIVSANEIRIRDGILVMQGCAASIDYGAYDSLTISNGTQSMLRTDIIAAQYEKDADTNVESLTLVVIEGTPDASDPQAPSLQGGDIQGGDNLVQLPLYQVNIDGVAIDSVEAQFAVTANLSEGTISPDVLAKWDDITGETANLNNIMDYVANEEWEDVVQFQASDMTLYHCTGTITGNMNVRVSKNRRAVYVSGRVAITNFTRTSTNPGVQVAGFTQLGLPSGVYVFCGFRGEAPYERVQWLTTDGYLTTTESFANAVNGRLTLHALGNVFYMPDWA